MQTLDIGPIIDEARWSGYQKLLIFATALTIILDGVDNQLLAAAIPSLISEWGVVRADFAFVLASGLIGMMIGGAAAGMIGDRFGRRVALLGSVFIFGILTIAVSFVDGLREMAVLRFLAGLGLGGAMPNGTALASEYVPRRHRTFAVTFTLVCIPLGGALAGVLGAYILPAWGWRMLFRAGGALPVALGTILIWALPESPRYLAKQRARWPELARLLRRLGHQVPEEAAFTDPAETTARTSFRQLLVPEFRRDTVALCASFFFCLLAAYSGVNWLPAMLSAAGFGGGFPSEGLLAFNLGGVAGAILAALVVRRLGSRPTMLAMCAGAVIGGIFIAASPLSGKPAAIVLGLLCWTGGWINATQTLMYALAAHVYPASIRATGVGTAVAFGRIGGVLSSYGGSFALGLSSAGSGLFVLLAVMMSLVLVALAVVERHIPATHRSSGRS